MYKVLFLTQWYPSQKSPVNGIFIREHAHAVSQFHDVTVFYIEGLHYQNHPTIKINLEMDDGLKTYRLSYSKPYFPKTSWLRRLSGTLRVVKELDLMNARPDIIQANIYSTADLAVFISRIYKIPAVLSEHATTYPRNLFTKTQALKTRFFMNRLKMVMPVSQNLTMHIQRYGIKGPFQVIPNTVDIKLFNPGVRKQSATDGIIRILFVGLLHEIKGVHHLIRALSIVQSEFKNYLLIVVGDGPERKTLESLTNELNLNLNVNFYGIKNKNEIAELMKQVDFLTLTSLWDNQPVVLLEAMASGLPVIASSIGGIPEIITPECGLLVQPGNEVDIANKIEFMIAHPGNYSPATISQYAQERFSYHAVGQQFSDLYKRVIEEYQTKSA
jgi:glycosyltransferase involved in cell wall biosynthesis